MTEFIELGYAGLFIASFLAATIVPFSSEVVFSALVASGLNAWNCVFIATAGNWLGGLTCYYVGKMGKLEWIEKYFRIKKDKLEKFTGYIHRYGDWFAFFSFLPGVGDAIAVASGFFRCRFWLVALSMLAGKFFRYVVWMYIHGFIF